MDFELFSLTWNNHRNTFFDALATAREKNKFCDATIACEGNLFPVHRFVLSTCSLYFDKILENISDIHPVIVLTDMKTEHIEDLLQYMYTGEVKILQKDIDSLIKAGEVLKIKGMEVLDENKKPKKNKLFIDDSENISEKRQRTDEFSENSRLNETSNEKTKNKGVNDSSEGCNEDKNQIDGLSGPSNQPISESLPIKEEILHPIDDDQWHFLGQFNESLMNEDQLSENNKTKSPKWKHNNIKLPESPIHKPYCCPLCKRGFKTNQDRLVHLVTEACTRADKFLTLVSMGWECNFCNKLFNGRDQAERHTRTHESGRMVTCPVCRQDFTGCRGNVLVKHVKGNHPEYLENICC